MKILLDTNVLIAAFIAHGMCSELFEHCLVEHTIYVSQWILDELYEKLVNKFGFSKTNADQVINFIRENTVIPLIFEEVKLDCGYRIDLLVERKLVIEIKSVEALNDIYLAQILTYLKLGNCKLGLLINFNVVLLKEGLRRVVNKL